MLVKAVAALQAVQEGKKEVNAKRSRICSKVRTLLRKLKHK